MIIYTTHSKRKNKQTNKQTVHKHTHTHRKEEEKEKSQPQNVHVNPPSILINVVNCVDSSIVVSLI
jgi:hypothetical protein